MTIKNAVSLIYDLVSEDITEDSDSEYQEAQKVIEKWLSKP